VREIRLRTIDKGVPHVVHLCFKSKRRRPRDGGTARFDVTGVLARQRAEGLWDGGAVTVAISTIGADVEGGATYLTVESAALIP
jgi:hypothetical protein